MRRMDEVLDYLRALGEFELRAFETLAFLLVLVLVRLLLLQVVHRQVTDARARYHWNKGITYAAAILAVFVLGRIWFVGFRTFATFLGLVSAGLVLALKEPVLNMAGWFFILWRRPFVLGDRIQIGSFSGDVIDRRLFQFSLLEIGNWVEADQSTGRVIHVPNGRVFLEPVANYTRGFPYLWNEVSMTVTFESDWRTAQRLLLEATQRHGLQLSAEAEQRIIAESQGAMIFYSTLSPKVYTRVTERGVQLTARYICGPRQRRGTEHAIWEDVLDGMRGRTDIDLAYPTQRFFDRAVEQRTLAVEQRPLPASQGAGEDAP
jgi:small-conductance mechanosensitive channel